MLLGCCSQRGSSIRSPEPEWSRVSRVTCHEAAAPSVRHNSCLDAQQSLEQSEGSEEGGSRASSGSCQKLAPAQPSPAQPAQPSPAQPSTTPGAGARDLDAGGGGGGHGGAAPVTLLCRGCYRCNASYPLIIAFTLVAYRYTRY